MALAGIEVNLSITPWQDEVRAQFNKILHRYYEKGVRLPKAGEEWVSSELARLSMEPCPTYRDIALVRQVAKSFSVDHETRTHIMAHPVFRNAFRWQVFNKALRLRRSSAAPVWAAELLLHFERPDWHVSLPKPKTIVLQPFFQPQSTSCVPLYRVSDFKGLEADSVILLLQGRTGNYRQATYVGVSRARTTLCVLAERNMLAAFPRDFIWDS